MKTRAKKYKILVITNDAAIGREIRKRLSVSAFTVVTHTVDNHRSVDLVLAKSPSLIIIDSRIGTRSECSVIAKKMKRHADIPILFIVPERQRSSNGRQPPPGFDGRLTTPFVASEVNTVVTHVLNTHAYEKSRKAQDQRNATILRTIDDGVLSTDHKGIVQSMNPAAQQLTGWNESLGIGKKVSLIFAVLQESNNRRIPDPVSRIIRTGKSLSLVRNAVLVSRRGTRYMIDFSGTPIFTETGSISGVILTFRDTTERHRIQNELNYNESRFRALIEKSSEAISILNKDGTIRYTTQAMTHILGYSVKEFVGRNTFEFTHPDEYESNISIFNKILRSPSRSISSNMRYKRKDGSWVWLEANSTNLVNDPGVMGIVMNFRDVTFRKESEKKLNHINQRLDLIARVSGQVVGSSPVQDQVWEMAGQIKKAFDVESVIIRTIQGEFSTLLTSVGMDESKLTKVLPAKYGLSGMVASSRHAITIADLNEKNSEIYDREPDVEDKTRKYFKSFAGAPMLMGHTVIGSIAIYTKKERRVFTPTDLEHLQIIANHIAIAIANNRLFREVREQNIEMTKHIEEQNKAEKMLRESEERYRSLVEYSPNAIAVHVDGIVRFVNKAAMQLMGAVDQNQLLGTKIMAYVHPDYRNAAVDRIKKVYSNEAVGNMEQQWIRLDGTPVDVEVISIPFEFEGQIAAQIIARDITERKRAENALRESELRFRSLFENAKDAVFISDTKTGVIIDANAESEKLLGRPRSEIIGMHQTQLHPPEQVDRALSLYRDQILTMGEHAIEFEVINAEGKRIPVEIKASVIRLDAHRVVVQGIFRDITERKNTEIILREKEERYRAFVEQSSEGIYRTVFDSPIPVTLSIEEQVRLMNDRSYIAECNTVFARMYGFASVEDALGVRIRSLVVPTDRTNIQLRKEFISKGYRLFDKESHERDILGNTKYFLNNIIGIFDGGQWVGVWGIQRDITDRRMAEEALRKSEEKYRALFEESKDGIYISTEEGTFIDVNPALVEILGYKTKEEVLNLDIKTEVYFKPSEREKFMQAIASRSYVRDLEVSLKRKDGSEVNVLLTSMVERGPDNTVIYYSGTIRDITEKKKLEQQLIQAQKMESIGTLAGGIAHDFNNLLAMILGVAELLKHKAKENKGITTYIDKIINASERGASISKQLLLFARPEQSELRPIAARQIVDEVKDFLNHFLPKNIVVQASYPNSTAILMGDAGHLHQALVNLALNAKDAMPEGGVLSILSSVVPGNDVKKIFPGAAGSEYVAIGIGDSGIGMEESVRQRIFEPFYSTKEKGKGTGLGLAIVHGIIKLHQAYIDVQSEPGKGTIFMLYFPSVKAEIQQSQSTKETMSNKNETILVVDDEEILREILYESLKEEGYEVLSAADGYEAIKIFEQHQDAIALVITDLGMPNMGGEELFKRLKTIQPDVKVVVSSGFLNSTTKSDLLKIGIKDILAKPYKFDSIFSTIRKTIDSK